MKRRALTGIQPSGTPHVGNWLGAIEPALALSDSCEGYYFIASYHALTTSRDPELLRQRILDVAATWLALGLDPTNEQMVDERYVTVAFGRDYADVPPLRGVIYTDSESSVINVSVDVAPYDGSLLRG